MRSAHAVGITFASPVGIALESQPTPKPTPLTALHIKDSDDRVQVRVGIYFKHPMWSGLTSMWSGLALGSIPEVLVTLIGSLKCIGGAGLSRARVRVTFPRVRVRVSVGARVVTITPTPTLSHT